jgi:hypothetical protein
MSQDGKMSPWVIGGPGRCGKTHLALSLWNHDGPVAGFPLEGLFTVYGRRRASFTRKSSQLLLEEYLTRPRFTDVDRLASERPLDYLSSSIDVLCDEFPNGHRDPIAMIGWVLERFAKENGRETWAAFDLHPEFRYPRLRRSIPGLRLVVMTRDAREAICAALFWRGDPGSRAARDARFKHSLIMFCLGMQVGRGLARQWPDDVEILDFNALVSGDRAERQHVARKFGISVDAVDAAYDFTPDFHFEPDKGFHLPDGRWQNLLTATELNEISVLTSQNAIPEPKTARPRWPFLLFARGVLAVGRISPGLARAIADVVYYPRRYVSRHINSIRRLASDIAHELGRAHQARGPAS